MIEDLNPAMPNSKNAGWLGHGTLVILYGAVVTGALLVRARRRASPRPNLLDLAVIGAGLLGVASVGGRFLSKRLESPNPLENTDGERISHPALNVQRISFA